MATLNFPNPDNLQTYTEAGITWTWNPTLKVWSAEGDQSSKGGSNVLSVDAGKGISVNKSVGAVVVTNEGVISAAGGTGIGVSTVNGATTIENTGVTGILGGSGISVNQQAGVVTVTSTNTGGGGGGDAPSNATDVTYEVGSTERTVQSRLEEYISVLDFGAVGDGVTNDTPAIQAAVNYCQANKRTLFFPSYTYKLLTSGTQLDQGKGVYNNEDNGRVEGTDPEFQYFGIPECAVHITQSIDIVATGAIFKLDITNTISRSSSSPPIQACHGFAFDNVNKGSFTGGRFEALNPAVRPTKALFKGAAVVMNNCTAVTVSNITCHNLKASCQMYDCTSCTISDCLGYRDKVYVDTADQIESGTFFGGYSGQYNLIQNCQTYGGCKDGDIYHYGSGYGNRIDHCKAFFTELGDDTYQILGINNQGLGLDAGQDSGSITNCTSYGHYYGIESKGVCGQTTLSNNLCVSNKICMTVRVGEVGNGNPGAAVSGHVLVDSNTLLPRHGNGNTAGSGNNNNTLGYQRAALELSKYSSVTVSNNYIGCEESQFATNNTETDYDFCGILAVNASATVNVDNPGVLSITNNRFQFVQKYYGNFSYSRGAMICVINYWEEASANNAFQSSVMCEGNTFTPHKNKTGGKQNDGTNSSNLPGADIGGRVIYFEGLNSLVYSNNTHGQFGSAEFRSVPYVQANKVLNFIGNANSFIKQTTAFHHTYPPNSVKDSKYQSTQSSIVTNNAFGQGSVATDGGEACVRVDGNGPCLVSNNSWFRVNRLAGQPNEGPLIEYNFSVNGDYIPLFCGLMATGNIMQIPQTFQSWYRVNGVQGSRQAYICTDNNLINGVTSIS